MSSGTYFLNDQALVPYFRGVDEFCAEYLAEDEDEKGDYETGWKIIADPIEDYAHLTPIEAAIVDTRLFQRLRFIRQLGFAFLVYPTLGYSRFEHAIGVLARLGQVVSALRANQEV